MQRKLDRGRDRDGWLADQPGKKTNKEAQTHTHNILMILIWKVISDKMGEWKILLIESRYGKKKRESESLRDDTLGLSISSHFFSFTIFDVMYVCVLRVFVSVSVCVWIDIVLPFFSITCVCVCAPLSMSWFIYFFSSIIIILFASNHQAILLCDILKHRAEKINDPSTEWC